MPAITGAEKDVPLDLLTEPSSAITTEPDPIVHQPTRLRIMMLLSGLQEADFNFLLNTLGLTKGNLSGQSAKLEDAGYVAIKKEFAGKIPKTTYTLTDLGREKLGEYWETMDRIRGDGRSRGKVPSPAPDAGADPNRRLV